MSGVREEKAVNFEEGSQITSNRGKIVIDSRCQFHSVFPSKWAKESLHSKGKKCPFLSKETKKTLSLPYWFFPPWFLIRLPPSFHAGVWSPRWSALKVMCLLITSVEPRWFERESERVYEYVLLERKKVRQFSIWCVGLSEIEYPALPRACVLLIVVFLFGRWQKWFWFPLWSSRCSDG